MTLHSSHTGRPWLVILLLLLVLPARISTAQGVTSEEVKASYLLQFSKYAWVDQPPRRVKEICYYEKSGVPENESTGQILTKYTREHPGSGLSVKWYKAINSFSGCDMVFIPAEEEDSVDNILTALGSSPILTVSGAKRFVFRGGMIGFTLDDANHVKMEGNLRNMRAHHVEMDTLVLELMQQVIGK